MNIIKIVFVITICIEIAASVILATFFWSTIKDETDKKSRAFWICLASLFSLAPIIQICMYIYYSLGLINDIFLR